MGALMAVGPLLMVQADDAWSRAVLTEALAVAGRRREPLAVAMANTCLGHATVVDGIPLGLEAERALRDLRNGFGQHRRDGLHHRKLPTEL